MATENNDSVRQHTGGCHCGAVKYTFTAPTKAHVHCCNCSICQMVGFQHLIVPKANFELQTDESALSCYTFGTGVAQHFFCRTCGVKSYYVPRSNPDGISVNMRCVDHSTFDEVTYEEFDGQNWERNAGSLAHLSKG